jgi:hypothetical protein
MEESFAAPRERTINIIVMQKTKNQSPKMSVAEKASASDTCESTIVSHFKDKTWQYVDEYLGMYGAESTTFLLHRLLEARIREAQEDETIVFDEMDITRLNSVIALVTQIETLGNAMRGLQHKIVTREYIRRNHQVLS